MNSRAGSQRRQLHVFGAHARAQILRHLLAHGGAGLWPPPLPPLPPIKPRQARPGSGLALRTYAKACQLPAREFWPQFCVRAAVHFYESELTNFCTQHAAECVRACVHACVRACVRTSERALTEVQHVCLHACFCAYVHVCATKSRCMCASCREQCSTWPKHAHVIHAPRVYTFAMLISVRAYNFYNHKSERSDRACTCVCVRVCDVYAHGVRQTRCPIRFGDCTSM